MKIHAVGSKEQKRAKRIVIEAQNEVEEAALYQHFLALRQEPPVLREWYFDVLKCLEDGPKTPREIADLLNMNATACNNRVAHVYEMGLVARRPHIDRKTPRGFVYWLNKRESGAPEPNDTLGDDI